MRTKDEQKYESICEASIDLINEVGFANASMSKIAKRAGVSPATIYIYFDNKEDLLNKLYLRVNKLLSKTMIPDTIDIENAEKTMKIIWLNLYKTLVNDRRSFEFIEQFINSPLINDVCLEEVWSHFSVIDELLKKAIRENIVKELPEELMCSFTFGSITDLVKKHHMARYVMSDNDITAMLSLAWDVMKK